MRLPRIRFSLKNLMIAVAIIGTILGTLAERRTRFRRLSVEYDRAWTELRVSDLELYLLLTVSQGESNESYDERRRAAAPLVQYLEYCGQMEVKYASASERPWLPVAADPPRPSIDREYVHKLINRYCTLAEDQDPPLTR